MADKLRWGILGTGNIARQFCNGVNGARRSVLTAVGSRTQASADAFAQTHRIPAAFTDYQAVIDSQDVDAIYVSLPNHMHYEWTIRSVRAGKHVLCEKPFAIDVAQTQEMFDESAKAGRLLVEAFMYRSHPQTLAVIEAVRSGAIGQLKMIRTSFCYRTKRIEDNIRFRADMAGGGLMDVGCYCINFSRLFAGEEPDEVQARGHLHESGVDDLVTGLMRFPSGIVASFTCGMCVQADNTAELCGTDGYIEIPVPWKPLPEGAGFTIAYGAAPRMDNASKAPVGPPPPEKRTVHAGLDLYALEADDFAASVLDGAPPRITPQDTLGNMRILDALRRQVGVKF